MKKALLTVICVFVGVMTWKIGEKLSADTIALFLGVILGVLATIPTGLLMIAASRRKENNVDRAYPVQQPPIMLFGGGQQPYQQEKQQAPMLPMTINHQSNFTKGTDIENADW